MYKTEFLNKGYVTFNDIVTNTVVTVEHVTHNRCYVSYDNGTTKRVPYMAAYQVVAEQSANHVRDKHYITEYTPAHV